MIRDQQFTVVIDSKGADLQLGLGQLPQRFYPLAIVACAPDLAG
jgi:hypothetical protein